MSFEGVSHPHAVYPRTTVNSYAAPLIKERMAAWAQFLESDLARPSAFASASVSAAATAKNNNSGNSNNASRTRKQRGAIDHILTYKGIGTNLFHATLQLDYDQLPSCCRQQHMISSSSSSSPAAAAEKEQAAIKKNQSSNMVPMVPLSTKVAEVCEAEMGRRKREETAANDQNIVGKAAGLQPVLHHFSSDPLFNVAEVVCRALESIQYAHMAKLVHGRICVDAFYVSSVEIPWAPTLCLGELPLVPQFFVDMGAALVKETNKNNAEQHQKQQQKEENEPHSSSSSLSSSSSTSPLLSWPCLVAPEIACRELYDAAADVWGIGVLTVQLCMASLGYPRQVWGGGVIQAAELADANLMSARLSGLPPAAVSFATMCLKRSPAQRPTIAGLLSHPWIRMHARIVEATQDLQQQQSPSGRKNRNDHDGDDEESNRCSGEDAKAAAAALAELAGRRTNNSKFQGSLQASKVCDVINALRQIRARAGAAAASDGQSNVAALASLPGASLVKPGQVQRRMKLHDMIAANQNRGKAQNDDDEVDDGSSGEEESDEEYEEEKESSDEDDRVDSSDDASSKKSD